MKACILKDEPIEMYFSIRGGRQNEPVELCMARNFFRNTRFDMQSAYATFEPFIGARARKQQPAFRPENVGLCMTTKNNDSGNGGRQVFEVRLFPWLLNIEWLRDMCSAKLSLRMRATLTSIKDKENTKVDLVCEMIRSRKQTHAGVDDFCGELSFDKVVFRAGRYFQGHISFELFADCWIVAENGAKIACNRIFTTDWKTVFFQMLKETAAVLNIDNAVKVDMTEEGVRALVKYMEDGSIEDAKKNGKIAVELLQAAENYEMTALENEMDRICTGIVEREESRQLESEDEGEESMEDGSAEKSEDELSVSEIFEIFVWAVKKGHSVKKKAARLLKAHSEKLETSHFTKLKKDPQALMELFLLC
ncbi:BTB and MATH domain-containing protein 42 [Orchesella cincta]|uniref:BTB and MATH domain-containing protein 42 n=1 Tax=Orchesella cincta TaxID=48709 RepID=A0A1D2MZ69_ORCCI|nr:BTB and MATH domain-containing protein 42 [Orchesella cincta]